MARLDIIEIYHKLEKLQKEGKNHIWSAIIKNNFAPIYAGQFDYVIGNPPWIHWEDLSLEYREATKDLWQIYELLPRRKGKGLLAESSAEFSVLFSYVCSDYYLRNGGTIGFLITQTVFKSNYRVVALEI